MRLPALILKLDDDSNINMAVGLREHLDLLNIEPPSFLTHPDIAIDSIKRRAKRRETFERLGRDLGIRLAYFLEDKEGWNGEERQKRIQEEKIKLRERVGEPPHPCLFE